MDSVARRSELNDRVSRDQRNAELAAAVAQYEFARFRGGPPPIDGLHGVTEHDRSRMDYAARRRATLEAIMANPFHAMVEANTEIVGENGDVQEKEQLWYANAAASTNEVLKSPDGTVSVLAWTHPGLQLALASDLGDYRNVRANGYRLRSVEPLARARFDATLPTISAVYQPGGAVRPVKTTATKIGLKAVKLSMTRDQVLAFVSRMSGMMVITGAPGSGKSTVAFQRIRFLFDQQDQRDPGSSLVPYMPALTRVFLANENLAGQAENLLASQLDIPTFVVASVGNFIDHYLEQVWLYRHNARMRQRKLRPLEAAARVAILGLSDHHDLRRLWEAYERQVAARLGAATGATWMSGDRDSADNLKKLAAAFVRCASKSPIGRDPSRSALTMRAIYPEVSRVYLAAREHMSATARDGFDEQFQQWLYWVYDPLSTVAAYFGGRESEAAHRMRRGTGARVNEAEILREAIAEWNERVYGPEDRPWLAWLLRFALPEMTNQQARFRKTPSAIAPAMTASQRWTHIAIDEAQDLCAAEASLLGSLVDPDGALTVSVDFRQVVSPGHGMTSIEALTIGRSLRGAASQQIYPFARNMRQSKQIGRFLKGFYEAVFNERPDFDANDELEDQKPQLIIAPPQDHALRIKQLVAVLKRSEVVSSIALLQINEDAQALLKLRAELEKLRMSLAPAWAASGSGLLTTSVERIKGIEFDACIVLGLEDVEKAALNFTLNRTYVALSRPTRRLALLCSEYPSLLRKMDKSLFGVTQS